MDNIKGLAHIGILTLDAEKSKDFYINNLGFKFDYETILHKSDGSSKKLLFVKLNNVMLEFIESSDKTNPICNSGVIDHISFEVENIHKICEQLIQKGIVFKTPQPINLPDVYNGAKIIFLEGPNGETLELFEYTSI